MEQYNIISDFFCKIEEIIKKSDHQDHLTEKLLTEFCRQKLLVKNQKLIIKLMQEAIVPSIASMSIIQP